MPVGMLRCYARGRHMASTNCNIFACARIVTPLRGVAHPRFILLLLCIVVLCRKFFLQQSEPAHPRRNREDYPLSHVMTDVM